MKKILMVGSAALFLVGTTGAFAATSGQGSSNDQQTTGSMNVKQQVEKSLQNSGYTDVEVVPTSFFVKAKDKQGTPVMMVIGPDSVTEVAAVPSKGEKSSGTAEGSSSTSKN